jgi:ACR3 family arsenite transporter
MPFYREVRDEIEAMLRAELESLLPGVALLPLPAAPAEAAAAAPKAEASGSEASASEGSAGDAVAAPAAAVPAAASSPLDFFASYLTIWVALCMIGGGLIGAFVPAAPEQLERASVAGVNGIIAALLWVMLFPMFVTLEWSALRRVADAPSSVILTAILSYAVKPFTMFGLGIFFTRIAFARHMPDPALRDSYVAGLVLLAGAPCTAMVFVWSALMNGSTANTLLMVGVNDLLMLALYVPICGLLIGSTSIALPWATIAASVAFFVLGPLLLAAGVRWAVLRARDEKFLLERVVAPIKPLTTVALLATLVIIFVFQGARIRDNVADVFLLAVPILIQCVLLWALCYGVAFAMCIPHERAGPASLIATSNFFELAVAVAVAIYGPGSGAALATVVGVLVEVPIMLLFTKVVNALKPRLDARCAACDETCAAYRFKGDRPASPALPMSLADASAPMKPLAAAAPAACGTSGKPCQC